MTVVPDTVTIYAREEVEIVASNMYRCDPSTTADDPHWLDLSYAQRAIWHKRAVHALSGLVAAGYKVLRG